MLYSLSGKLIFKSSQFAAIEVNGIGFKIFISAKTFKNLPKIGRKTKLFCVMNVNQKGSDIYGFLDKKEMEIFELLTSVSGIGSKSAMAILSKISYERLVLAIKNKKTDLISEASGVGRKKSERIILELKDKIKKTSGISGDVDFDREKDIKSALENIGYKRKEIEEALENIKMSGKMEENFKSAIKFLSAK